MVHHDKSIRNILEKLDYHRNHRSSRWFNNKVKGDSFKEILVIFQECSEYGTSISQMHFKVGSTVVQEC